MIRHHAAAREQIGVRLGHALGQTGRTGGEEDGCGLMIVDARGIAGRACFDAPGKRDDRKIGRLLRGIDLRRFDKGQHRPGEIDGVREMRVGRLIIDQDEDRPEPPDGEHCGRKLRRVARPRHAARSAGHAPARQIDRHAVRHAAQFGKADRAITANQCRLIGVGTRNSLECPPERPHPVSSYAASEIFLATGLSAIVRQ